jgi:hypothetical protein
VREFIFSFFPEEEMPGGMPVVFKDICDPL